MIRKLVIEVDCGDKACGDCRCLMGEATCAALGRRLSRSLPYGTWRLPECIAAEKAAKGES